MFFGDEGQREEHDKPRARNVGSNEIEGLHGRKRDTRGLNAGLRSKQEQFEPLGILHVVFVETEIVVHLHQKYYLSIA